MHSSPALGVMEWTTHGRSLAMTMTSLTSDTRSATGDMRRCMGTATQWNPSSWRRLSSSGPGDVTATMS